MLTRSPLHSRAPASFLSERTEIPQGTLVIHGSRIEAIGPAAELTIPKNAERIDVSGKIIMPGLICTHSHIGGIGGADGSSPIQPGVRVFDSINVRDSGFRRALAGGLTTLNIMPGSGHLISGQTVYVKLRFYDDSPRDIDDLMIRDPQGNIAGRAQDGQRHQLDAGSTVSGNSRKISFPGA